MMQRESGVLLHISSLPNQFGIGSFGKTAYDFIDFLNETKQSYWQILPLTTTSYGDSPYQSFSAFAGNTHFIDFDLLFEDHLLEKKDYNQLKFAESDTTVDYERLFKMRRPILEKAVTHFIENPEYMQLLDQFIKKEAWWLTSFSEFMAIKEYFNHQPWNKWDENIRNRESDALIFYRKKLKSQIQYHIITQYLFFKQWFELKEYANQKNIKIIGDIPIYVAYDSVEVWATPEYFKLDENKIPITVAGTPPDNFSSDGQYWGNPIYDWNYMENEDYQWWIRRIKESLTIYDAVRIDHFRGFDAFWEIPYGAPTASTGSWSKGPGIDLFKSIKNNLGKVNIIAEDLGFMTQSVIDLRNWTEYPGMKILQFAFNGYDIDSTDLPFHYPVNSIAYVGTHDNETCEGWFKDTANNEMKEQASRYLKQLPNEPISAAFNKGIAASNSRIAIYTMQDLLHLDNSARMNTPSTLGGNWTWRMKSNDITQSLIHSLSEMTNLYFRENKALSNIKKKDIEATSPDL